MDEVVVEAAQGADGATVVSRLLGTEPWRPRRVVGSAALRGPTGGARVALAQTRASLVAGDDIQLRVIVGPGACLELVELGALLSHDVRGGAGNRLLTTIELAADATLIWLGQPLVASAGCATARTTLADLATGARLLLGESVVLGRAGQRPGALASRTRITQCGQAILEERLETADLALLESAVVAGPARMIASLTLAGLRDPDPDLADVMQAHGLGSLWRGVGRSLEQVARSDALAARWRELLAPMPALPLAGAVEPARDASPR